MTRHHENSPIIAFLDQSLSETPDLDRVSGAPLPREMLSLLGHEAVEREFLNLYTSGKMHHAFLLTGPEGIGKATFAYRAARFLLSEDERSDDIGTDALFGPVGPEDMSVPASSRTAHLIANTAHPDLGVLARRYDVKTKKFRQEISVEDTRNVLSLFEKTAAFGGWRVIIVDAADDLNNASANALLKTLEEPPKRAIFFLIAHQPQKLLPTIRSRCRSLAFEPLNENALRALLMAFGGAGGQEDAIVQRASGSIRQALRLRGAGLVNYLALVERVLSTLPRSSPSDIDRVAEATKTGAEGALALQDVMSAIETWLHAGMRARILAGEGAYACAPFADLWAKLQDSAARVDALNLDRRAFIITTFDELAALVSQR